MEESLSEEVTYCWFKSYNKGCSSFIDSSVIYSLDPQFTSCAHLMLIMFSQTSGDLDYGMLAI